MRRHFATAGIFVSKPHLTDRGKMRGPNACPFLAALSTRAPMQRLPLAMRLVAYAATTCRPEAVSLLHGFAQEAE